MPTHFQNQLLTRGLFTPSRLRPEHEPVPPLDFEAQQRAFVAQQLGIPQQMQQAVPQPMPPQIPPEQAGGITGTLLNLFGGGRGSGANADALIDAGFAMVNASNPQGIGPAPNLLQVIGAGRAAGQGSALQREQLERQKLAQEQVGNIMRSERPDKLEQSYEVLLSAGMYGEAQQLGQIIMTREAAQRRAQQGTVVPRGSMLVSIDPLTGEETILYNDADPDRELRVANEGDDVVGVDKNTGEEVWRRKGANKPSSQQLTVREQIEEQRSFQRENALRDDYEKQVKAVEPSYRLSKAAMDDVAGARAGNGPAQVALLYGFVRALDPNSVVREGEVRLAQQAAALRQRAVGIYEKYLKGEAVVIPADMVDQIAEIMTRLNEYNEQYLKQAEDQYRNRAERWGVDPEAIRSTTDILTLEPSVDVGSMTVDDMVEKAPKLDLTGSNAAGRGD